MSLPDVCVQVLQFAAAHSINKVLLVVFCTAAYELPDSIAVLVIGPAPAKFSAGEIPTLAMDDIPASDLPIMGPGTNAFFYGHSRHLEQDRSRFIVKEYKLGIG